MSREPRTQLEAVPPATTRLAPPACLSPASAREWTDIVNSLPAGYFRPSDIPMLIAFCTSSAKFKEAADHLERDGMLVMGKFGMGAHPANSMMLQHASAMSQLATKLRLCPSARYAKGEKPQKGVEGGGGERPWDKTATG